MLLPLRWTGVRPVSAGQVGDAFHMLVLIRDWLLAGVSSPWLPSLGGDCSGQRGQWRLCKSCPFLTPGCSP